MTCLEDDNGCDRVFRIKLPDLMADAVNGGRLRSELGR